MKNAATAILTGAMLVSGAAAMAQPSGLLESYSKDMAQIKTGAVDSVPAGKIPTVMSPQLVDKMVFYSESLRGLAEISARKKAAEVNGWYALDGGQYNVYAIKQIPPASTVPNVVAEYPYYSGSETMRMYARSQAQAYAAKVGGKVVESNSKYKVLLGETVTVYNPFTPACMGHFYYYAPSEDIKRDALRQANKLAKEIGGRVVESGGHYEVYADPLPQLGEPNSLEMVVEFGGQKDKALEYANGQAGKMNGFVRENLAYFEIYTK